MIRDIGLFVLLIPCGICDLRTRLVPVWYTGIFAGLSVLYHILFAPEMLTQMAAGAVMGMVFILISRVSKGALGMGDSAVITALGVWCGVRDGFPLVLFAFILSGIFGGIWMLIRKKNRRDSLPFVPFLLLSAAVSCVISICGGTWSL